MKKLFLIFITGLIFFTVQAYNKVWAASTLTIVPPKNVNLGTINMADYETGYKEKIRATVLLVKDDTNNWKLMVATLDSNMGVIGDYTKPIGDFKWRASGAKAMQLTYTDLTNYDVEAARGLKSGTTNIMYIDYRILLAWGNDVPGVYNINILYTLTTQ